MNVVVNALSVNNQSGRHVLLGHLSKLAEWTVDHHQYTVLHHAGNRDMVGSLTASNVDWVQVPNYTSNWVLRTLWERFVLPQKVAGLDVDFLFTPAGVASPTLKAPQVVFCQNPWCLVPSLTRTPIERIKAALQRKAYKDAMKRAAIMIFNSEFMHQAYCENASCDAQTSLIVYQAIADEMHDIVSNSAQEVKRVKSQIVSVSVMAPHKGAETVVEALSILHRDMDLPATLKLVGPWPHKPYEEQIRAQVRTLKLQDSVQFCGRVSNEELHRSYRESQVFCLMSHCESFGIPAVESQAFGTPVVSSNCCAIPEICGKGGLYPEPGDAAGTAEALHRMLTDNSFWNRMSKAAIENARSYRWESCSRGMLKIFDIISDSQS